MSNETASLPSDEFRETLRHEMLRWREDLDAAQLQVLSASLAPRLAALLGHLQPRVIGFCWPWRGEFDAHGLIAQWLAEDARRAAALPVIEAVAAPMRFRAWTPGAPLVSGRFGIQVPAGGEWLHPDLFLMPVVAVDRAGFRLGYGGGYFDRTLAALDPRPLAVGVGFDAQVVDSIAPQPWDERLDWVITESVSIRTGTGN